MDLFKNSSWITMPEYRMVPGVYLDFLDTFSIAVPASSYILYISAQSDYAVSVNGELAGFGQYPSLPTAVVYDRLDLGGLFRSGKNELKVTVFSEGANTAVHRVGEARVIYELYCDGELLAFSSDDTMVRCNPAYRSGCTELLTREIGISFDYTFGFEQSTDGYNRAGAVSARKPDSERPISRLVTGKPAQALVLSQGVFLDSHRKTSGVAERMKNAYLSPRDFFEMTGGHIPPQTVPEENGFLFNAAGYESGTDGIFVILDLRRETAGMFYMDVVMPYEADILFAYGEHLCDLRVRASIDERGFAFRVHARAGRCRLLFPFRRFAMRYLQMHVYADNFSLRYAGVCPTEYPFSTQPCFTCTDALHQRIYDTCRRTLLLSMHDHCENSPWREQAMYAPDMRMQLLCGYYVFGEYRFAAAQLSLFAAGIDEEGRCPTCPPGQTDEMIPGHGMYFVLALYEYVLHSGDTALGTELLYAARSCVEWLRGLCANEMGLPAAPCGTDVWNFYDWQVGLSGSERATGESEPEGVRYDAPLAALLSIGLRSLSGLYSSLGHAKEAAYYNGVKQLLDRHIFETFYHSETAVYRTYFRGQTTYHEAELTQALLLFADAVPQQYRAALTEKLARGGLVPSTLGSAFFKYEAMMQDPDRYAKEVFADIAKRYGDMLYAGATAFYETEDGPAAMGNAGSLCQGMSAYPAYFYFRYALGLQPDQTSSFRKPIIAPVDCGLGTCKGRTMTPFGEVML